MNTINNQSIIRLQAPFASGAEHNVCLLENQQLTDCSHVYKYPECFWNANDASIMNSNLDLLNKLGIQTLETEILDPRFICVDGEFCSVPYVIKQEFNTQPILSELDLLNPEIANKLKNYVSISNELYLNENKAIDFLGAEAAKGLFKFFINKSEPLKVFNFKLNTLDEILLMDTGVFVLDKIPPVFRPAIHFIIQIQHYLLFKVLEFNGSIFEKMPYINFCNKSIAYSTFLATRIYQPFKKY